MCMVDQSFIQRVDTSLEYQNRHVSSKLGGLSIITDLLDQTLTKNNIILNHFPQ